MAKFGAFGGRYASKPRAIFVKQQAQRYRRVEFSVPLTLHRLTDSGIRITHGISLDLSEDGLGALVQSLLLVGETVEIDLRLPEKTLSVVGVVRHSSSTRCGFEFLGLTPAERRLIDECLRLPVSSPGSVPAWDQETSG